MFEIDLVATVLSVSRGEPHILVLQTTKGGKPGWRLPTVPYKANSLDCLDTSLRDGLAEMSGVRVGFVEQISTELVSSNRNYDGEMPQSAPRLSISYVAIANMKTAGSMRGRHVWMPLYALLPWEDWRSGKPSIIRSTIESRLEAWAGASPDLSEARRNDVRIGFGTCQGGWDEEKTSERLDLLLAADCVGDLLREHHQGRRNAKEDEGLRAVDCDERHLRHVARALCRLRGQIKSKPIVFEMVADRFTLYELQQTVEAILGPPLHKQNFRRLVEHMGLVEPTGEIKSHTGGRPAQLFRFRPSVVLEHVHPGMRVRGARL